MRRIFLAAALAFHVSIAAAQTTAPSVPMPVTTDLGAGCVIDLPPGWVSTSDLSLTGGFNHPRTAECIGGFHPAGGRPTDLPYTLVDLYLGLTRLTTAEQETQIENRVAFYNTAIYPPSKADRVGSWKKVKVDSPKVDARNRRYTLHATIHYDGTGDYDVTETGIFTSIGLIVVTTWADGSAASTDANAIAAMADSLRFASGPPPLSFQDQLIYFAKVAGVLLVILIVGVQIFVLFRDRQERRRLATED